MATYSATILLFPVDTTGHLPFVYTFRARDSAAPRGLGYITWTSRYLLGYDTAPTPYPFGGPLEDLKIISVAAA
jgi:hypothetical protein